ncbi:MAG TPA: ectoine synthase [Polyangiaceae bacterium LLY-WYZ-14_1]|jgi:L-ectoine synthase|nr:ectoine synthase [Polyangiaceae bacterium LLY-WYZ-14_1]
MIVKKLGQLPGDRVVEGKTWTSRRLLLRDEGMGFSMHDTVLRAGTTTVMHYKNHLEAVYCIEGKGKLIDRDRNEEHVIEAGTIYALDKHDRHTLVAEEDLRMICVFNPALVGPENHDEDGSYELL